MSLPKFDTPLKQVEVDTHLNGFYIKMVRCTRRAGIQNIPPIINILRLSTDFNGFQQKESWDSILTFLNVSGYDVQDIQATKVRDADLLFISVDSDRLKDVEYLTSMIAQGFLGLMPRDEILVSGAGTPGRSPYDVPINAPILLGTDYAVYGMCLIHGYIRAYGDIRTLQSRYMSMMILLEGKIHDGMVGPGVKVESAGDKIKAFETLLKDRKHVDGEARWVLAVLNLLRNLRNFVSHTPPLPKTRGGVDDAIKVIHELVVEYNRPLGKPQDPTKNIYGVEKRWITQLVQITSRWIDEYIQAYPVKSGSTK